MSVRPTAAALAFAALLWSGPIFAAGSPLGKPSRNRASGDAAAARVLAVKGLVQARSGEAAEWKGLSKNDALAEGDEVSTGADSFCELGFLDSGKGSVRLQPDSRAKLVSADPVRLNLLSGRVFSLVRELKKGSDFQISSPTAIASARGTGWDQSANRLAVYEDTVHLAASAGQEEDVPAGRGFEIGDDGVLGAGFAVSDEEMARWEDFRREAAKNLDNYVSAETLSLIDQNDPVQDILHNKDAFDDLNDQDPFEESDKQTDGGGTGGTQGSGTGG